MDIPNCSELKDLKNTISGPVNGPPTTSNDGKRKQGIYTKFLQRSQSFRKKPEDEGESHLNSVINNKSVINNEAEKYSIGARNGTVCDPTGLRNSPPTQCTTHLLNTSYGSGTPPGHPPRFPRTPQTTTVCTESEAAIVYLYTLIDGVVTNELEQLLSYEVGETIYYLKKYEDSLISEISRRKNLKAILEQKKKQKSLVEDTNFQAPILPDGGATPVVAPSSDQSDSEVSSSSHRAAPRGILPTYLMKDWTVVRGLDADDIRVSGDILDVKNQSLVEKSHTSSRVISTPATNVIKTNCCVYYLIGKFTFPSFNKSRQADQERKLSPLQRENNASNDNMSQKMNLKKKTHTNHTSPSESQEDLGETRTPLSSKRKKRKRRSHERKLK